MLIANNKILDSISRLCVLFVFVFVSDVFGVCQQGYVDVSGVCVQQATQCPSNYYLVNGMCFPAYQGNCQQAEVYVNGKCCTTRCLQGCYGLLYCECCTVSLTISPHEPAPPLIQTTPPPQIVAPCNPQPCTTQQIAPCTVQPCTTLPCTTTTQPCPTQPIMPYPFPVATPCPAPYPPIIIPTIYPPCTTPPPTTPPPTTQPPTTQPPTTQPPTTRPPITQPPTTQPPTTTPPPGPLIQCPPGTIFIGGTCRLIYCGKGVYQNNRCIQTVCPAGTVWTGIKCAVPEPTVQSVVFNNTVITHFKRNDSDIIVNNVNNFNFNNTIEVPSNEAPPPQEDYDEATGLPPTVTPPTTTTSSTPKKCCNVLTPRVCSPHPQSGQWNCYTRRYRRCGEFCVAPTIYLKAPRIRQVDPYLVMPPDNHISTCRQANSCGESIEPYDCSGCASGHAETCASYCYRSSCMTRGCAFYDQQAYCYHSPGGYGCQEQDGCFDDWCGEDSY